MTFTAPLPLDMRQMVHKVSTGLPSVLVDDVSNKLTCIISVPGKEAGDKSTGFVPYDRLMMEEV
jgi:hypothetical protein